MVLKTRKSADRANETEIGTIRKSWRGRIRFALIYPNRYHLGMSNLGFQSVYRLLNNYDHVVCERVFLPEPTPKKQKPLRTFESGKRLTDADILAFSLSFENDYPHILSILDNIGLPLRAEHRGDEDPLLLAGGVASFINPESIAPFFDCFLMGEAEVMLPRFVEIF
ncbi:MAG: radical SAM protein, partial [Desulfobacteraceae bacterium]